MKTLIAKRSGSRNIKRVFLHLINEGWQYCRENRPMAKKEIFRSILSVFTEISQHPAKVVLYNNKLQLKKTLFAHTKSTY
jgi:hypothetical protein